MATLKQKRVVKEIVENLKRDKPMSAGKILENIGYSEAIAKNPKYVLESKGVRAELTKLGFTEESAKQIVAEILDAPLPLSKVTASDKLRAAELIFKVLGSYAPERHQNQNIDIRTVFTDEQMLRIAERIVKRGQEKNNEEQGLN